MSTAKAAQLARRLQAAAYSHGYEDAHPSDSMSRQARTDAVSRQTLAELLAEIERICAQPEAGHAD